MAVQKTTSKIQDIPLRRSLRVRPAVNYTGRQESKPQNGKTAPCSAPKTSKKKKRLKVNTASDQEIPGGAQLPLQISEIVQIPATAVADEAALLIGPIRFPKLSAAKQQNTNPLSKGARKRLRRRIANAEAHTLTQKSVSLGILLERSTALVKSLQSELSDLKERVADDVALEQILDQDREDEVSAWREKNEFMTKTVSEFISTDIIEGKLEIQDARLKQGILLVSEELDRLKAQKEELALMKAQREELATEKSMFQKDKNDLKALTHVGVAVRLRFLEHAKHLVLKKERKQFNHINVQNGNSAAHSANIVADASLLTAVSELRVSKTNNLEELFTRLYGCHPHDRVAITSYPPILHKALTSWIFIAGESCWQDSQVQEELISESKTIIEELRDSWTRLFATNETMEAAEIFELGVEYQIKEKRIAVIAAQIMQSKRRKRNLTVSGVCTWQRREEEGPVEGEKVRK